MHPNFEEIRRLAKGFIDSQNKLEVLEKMKELSLNLPSEAQPMGKLFVQTGTQLLKEGVEALRKERERLYVLWHNPDVKHGAKLIPERRIFVITSYSITS